MKLPIHNPNFSSRFNVSIAKQKLYGELLKLSNEELTENEVDLMFSLSKDKDIQEVLNQRFKTP